MEFSGKKMILAAAVAAALGMSTAARAAAFTANDIVVLSALGSATGNTTSNTNFDLLELSSTTIGQANPVQPIINGGINGSASASSTGYLKLTDGGTLLTYTGIARTTNATGKANANLTTARIVATVGNNGVVNNAAATYTGTSAQQTRSAVTTDGTNFYIADQGGLYRNGETANDNAANGRALQIFGSQTYVLQASTTAAFLSTLSPASPSSTGLVTLTGVTGLTTGNTTATQDFILLSSTGSTTTPDTLYISSASSASNGTIAKYYYNGSTWVAAGTRSLTSGIFGITARVDATSGFDVFYTTGTGATINNAVVEFNDNTAYNASISTTATLNTLYTATGSNILKGIAFAPITAATTSLAVSYTAGSTSPAGYSSFTTLANPAVNATLNESTSAYPGGLFANVTPANKGYVATSNIGTGPQFFLVDFTFGGTATLDTLLQSLQTLAPAGFNISKLSSPSNSILASAFASLDSFDANTLVFTSTTTPIAANGFFAIDVSNQNGVNISKVGIIPEPASMGLLAVGALSLIARRRKA